MTARPAIRDFVDAIGPRQQLTQAGSGYWMTNCPGHDDSDPSLQVWIDDKGKLALHCFGPCDEKRVHESLPARARELRESTWRRPGPDVVRPRRRVAEYEYSNATGRTTHRKVRYEPKSFSWEHTVDSGASWQKGYGEFSRPTLYRRAELPDAGRVFVPEGERDADSVAALGLPSTTLASRGIKNLDCLEELAGLEVVVLADNDRKGRQLAIEAASRCYELGISVRVLQLPGLPESGDVTDWIQQGGTADELEALADAAPPFSPATTTEVRPRSRRADTVQPRAVSWLWPGWLPRGKYVLLDGDPELGKSTLTLDLAARITRGSPMPDGTPGQRPRNVIVMSVEDDEEDTVVPRLIAAGADLSRVILYDADFRLPSNIDGLEADIVTDDVALVIADPLVVFLDPDIDAHRDAHVRSALHPLKDLCQRTGVVFMGIRHLKKATTGSAISAGGGSIGIVAAARGALLAARHPDSPETNVLAVTKANLARKPNSLAYRMSEVEVHDPATGEPLCDPETGEVQLYPRIEWLGGTQFTADELIQAKEQAQRDDPSEIDDAVEFLNQQLQGGPKEVQIVKDLAKRSGITRRTLRRASEKLRVDKRPAGFQRPWVWSLPGHTDEDSAQSSDYLANSAHTDPLQGSSLVDSAAQGMADSAELSELATPDAPPPCGDEWELDFTLDVPTLRKNDELQPW